MAVSGSVQFFGKEAVIAAYTARGIDTWGLFAGKQFINAGEDLDSLNAFLVMLEPGGSQAVYTLKVYRDVEDIDMLTDKVECNGSFNFKLFSVMAPSSLNAGALHGERQYDGDPVMRRLHGIVTAQVADVLEKRFSKQEAEAEEEEETVSGIIMGYLKDPEKLIGVINAVRGLVVPAGAPVHPAAVQMQLAGHAEPLRKVGAVASPLESQPRQVLSADEKLQRLADALDRLEKCDPELLLHLEQLADLAEKQPAKYKMAISFL